MSDWRPIETAPKDGCEILLALKEDNLRGFSVWVGSWGKDYDREGWCDEGLLISEGEFLGWQTLSTPKAGEPA